MMNQSNKKTHLIKAIKEYSNTASRGQKKAALSFLALNTAFERTSISYVCKQIGVSETTLKRFLAALGYDKLQEFLEQLYRELGFAELRNDIVNIGNKDSEKRISEEKIFEEKIFEEKISEEKFSKEKISDKRNDRNVNGHANETAVRTYRAVASQEKESLDATMEMLNEDAVQQALELLAGASKVYILGIRGCYPIAMVLSYYLKMIGIETVLISTSDMNEIFEQMVHIKEKDLFFAISFADYSLRTLRALEYANEKKASIITLTDGKYSPMNMYSSCNLWAKIGQMSIVDSMTAPLSVIYYLTAELADRLGEQVKDNMKQLEQVWENNDVYGNDALIAQSKKEMNKNG